MRGFVRAGEECHVTVNGRETCIDRAIYRPAYEMAVAMLLKVRDEGLVREAEKVLEKGKRLQKKSSGKVTTCVIRFPTSLLN